MVRLNDKAKGALQDVAVIAVGILATALFLGIIYLILAEALFLPALQVLCLIGPY